MSYLLAIFDYFYEITTVDYPNNYTNINYSNSVIMLSILLTYRVHFLLRNECLRKTPLTESIFSNLSFVETQLRRAEKITNNNKYYGYFNTCLKIC